eukprot:gene47135-63128_t
MTVVLAIVYRDRLNVGLFGGLLASGPVFVLVGALLAKLGYQRKTLRQLRRETDERLAAKAAEAGVPRGSARAHEAHLGRRQPSRPAQETLTPVGAGHGGRRPVKTPPMYDTNTTPHAPRGPRPGAKAIDAGTTAGR